MSVKERKNDADIANKQKSARALKILLTISTVCVSCLGATDSALRYQRVVRVSTSLRESVYDGVACYVK